MVKKKIVQCAKEIYAQGLRRSNNNMQIFICHDAQNLNGVDMKNIPETSQPPFVANMGWKEEIREERGRQGKREKKNEFPASL